MTDAKTLDPQVLAEMDKEELRRLEHEIARRHIEGLSWFMVFWPFANLICWLSLWPLVLTGTLSALGCLSDCLFQYLLQLFAVA